MGEAQKTADILIIESDAAVSKVLARMLTREGFSVRIVPDSAEAISALSEPGHPGLILADLVSGPMSTEMFLAHCQRNPALRAIPVVVLVASMPPGLFERLSVADILSKPPSHTTLLKVVRRHFLPRQEGAPPSGSPATG